MLFGKVRRNKKGITLVETVVAIAVTAILAVCLSNMLVPIVNVYAKNRTRVELQEAVVGRLNDIALNLRGADGVYVTTDTRSFFKDVKTDQVLWDGCRKFDVHYAIAQDNWYEANSPKIKGYRYPEMGILEFGASKEKSKVYGASHWDEKLVSDEYQDYTISCPTTEDFYFYVRNNENDRAVCLEVHLNVKKGDVTYEGSKYIVCENLLLQKNDSMHGKIFLNNFVWSDALQDFVLTAATVSTGTNASNWTKYYSVWFSKL